MRKYERRIRPVGGLGWGFGKKLGEILANLLILAFLFLVAVMWWREASAATGIYQGEENSGLNKICYYSSPRGTVAITIRSHQVCPRSISL